MSSSSSGTGVGSGTGAGAGAGAGAPTVGGFLAPSNLNARGGGQHLRTISLPVFSQGPGTSNTETAGVQGLGRAEQEMAGNLKGLGSGLGGFGNGGNGFGLALQK